MVSLFVFSDSEELNEVRNKELEVMKQNTLILHCLAGVPEEALRAIALLQANSYGSLIPGQILSNPSPYQELTAKLYQPILSTQTNDFYASVCVDYEKYPEIVNILGVMKFLVYGSLIYNVVGGQLDYFHPISDSTWRYNHKELPYFGNVPDTGQYSLKQRATYWLLSHLPFDNGTITLVFQEGETFLVAMHSTDYLCVTKQE